MAAKKKEASNTVAFLIAAVLVIGFIHISHSSARISHLFSSGNNLSNEKLAQKMAAKYHWTGKEWIALDNLWTRESGFKIVWNYQGSGAFGIPQSLPANKMAIEGPGWMTSPSKQIKWGLSYIKRRYGDPENAWSHEVSHSWY